MDAETCPDNDGAVPCNGDISLCLNCGALYKMRFKRWKPMSGKEFDKLPDGVKKTIVQYEAARQNIVSR